MKRFSKLIVNLVAGIMLAVSCFCLVGCEEIVTLEVTLSVYDFDNETWLDEEDTTLTIDLYRHLADQTVDAITSYAQAGYYDNLPFYSLPYEGYKAIMIGDYKFNGTSLVQTERKVALDGEFEHGMTTGSNLTNKKGAVGLWRTWFAQDDGGNAHKASNGMDTGRATWFLPTTAIADYNGYFCIFGQIDLDDETNNTAFSAVEKALKTSANCEEYIVYYTNGENYTTDNSVANNGLTFNYMDKTVFEEQYGKSPTVDELEKNGIFVPENDQYVCYAHHTIRIAMADGAVAAKIKSIKVK